MLIEYNIKFENLERSVNGINNKVDKIEKNLSNMANNLREVLGTDRKKLKSAENSGEKSRIKLEEEKREVKKAVRPKKKKKMLLNMEFIRSI